MRTLQTLPLLFFLCLPACSNNDNDKNANASTPQETPAPVPGVTNPPETTTPTPENPQNPAVSTPAPGAANWEINAANCALYGYSYNDSYKECEPIYSKEACDELNNGSEFRLRYGVGSCVGPALIENEANCAKAGMKFQAEQRRCVPITNEAECKALNNGSVFDAGYDYCVGPQFLPSNENCAAYGRSFDKTSGSCKKIRSKAECDALNSGAEFDEGWEICLGRCMIRESITDQCFLERQYFRS